MVAFSMILTDPSFQGHGIFEVEYLKKSLRDKVTMEH